MDFAFAQRAPSPIKLQKKGFEAMPLESESFPLQVVPWCFASQDMPTCEESEIFVNRGNDSEAKIFVDRPGMEMGCK